MSKSLATAKHIFDAKKTTTRTITLQTRDRSTEDVAYKNNRNFTLITYGKTMSVHSKRELIPVTTLATDKKRCIGCARRTWLPVDDFLRFVPVTLRVGGHAIGPLALPLHWCLSCLEWNVLEGRKNPSCNFIFKGDIPFPNWLLRHIPCLKGVKLYVEKSPVKLVWYCFKIVEHLFMIFKKSGIFCSFRNHS